MKLSQRKRPFSVIRAGFLGAWKKTNIAASDRQKFIDSAVIYQIVGNDLHILAVAHPARRHVMDQAGEFCEPSARRAAE